MIFEVENVSLLPLDLHVSDTGVGNLGSQKKESQTQIPIPGIAGIPKILGLSADPWSDDSHRAVTVGHQLLVNSKRRGVDYYLKYFATVLNDFRKSGHKIKKRQFYYIFFFILKDDHCHQAKNSGTQIYKLIVNKFTSRTREKTKFPFLTEYLLVMS